MAGHINVYKGQSLVSRAEVANTNWEKCKGLMFSRQKDILFNFQKDKKLKFHMVFVFYPIDIIFMDHEYKIVDLKKSFCPFTCYYSRAKSSHVLELAKGTINKHEIGLGEILYVGNSPPAKPLRKVDKKRRVAAKNNKRPVKTTTNKNASTKSTKRKTVPKKSNTPSTKRKSTPKRTKK
ncbi:MAG: DUF192 domain-containing protein [Candidatus Woesearchaeota archaeon]